MLKRSKANWTTDIAKMHKKFGVNKVVKDMDERTKALLLQFRISMIEEELGELKEAHYKRDAEGVVDALIDQAVFIIGTLNILGVDADLAWDEVYKANMAKEPGIKLNRPNPLGLPDMLKPEGWKEPDLNCKKCLGDTKDFLQ